MKVTVPKKLTKAEREALEGYQKVSRENPREQVFAMTGPTRVWCAMAPRGVGFALLNLVDLALIEGGAATSSR